jgi:prevent-host-death family protein
VQCGKARDAQFAVSIPGSVDLISDTGYAQSVMQVSLAEAQSQFPELIRAVEAGEKVVITRQGKPIAQIAPMTQEPRKVRFDGMRERIELLPGWNDPLDPDRFLTGDL